MIWAQVSIYSALILGILTLELAIASRSVAQEGRITLVERSYVLALPNGSEVYKQSDDLPLPPRNPDSSSAGGRRDRSACPQDPEVEGPVLTALSPTTGLGLTQSERPEFLVYVPSTNAQFAEFSLRTATDQGIYQTTISLQNVPGIIRLTLPAEVPPLEVGTEYIWSFNVICNPDDRLDDRFVTEPVHRVEIGDELMHQIEQASPAARVEQLARRGLWYDAIVLAYDLHRSQPNNVSIDRQWKHLLQSGGLAAIPDLNLNHP